MPPKKSSNSDIGLTASNVAVIRSALLNLKTAFDPDWEAVRSEIGISHKNNAQRDFRQAIAKLDLNLLKGKIINTATADDDAAAAANANAEDGNDARNGAAAGTKGAKGTKHKANQEDTEGTTVKGKKAKKAEKDDSADESD